MVPVLGILLKFHPASTLLKAQDWDLTRTRVNFLTSSLQERHTPRNLRPNESQTLTPELSYHPPIRFRFLPVRSSI